MIATLRKKFILVAMLSTMLVLTAIMGTVNISNYVKMIRRADSMTALLARDDNIFDDKEGIKDGEKKPEPGKDGMGDDGMSPETPFDTRYFTVTVDENGTVTETDLDRIAAVDEDEAAEYAESLSGTSKEKGFCGIYRYYKVDTDDTTVYIFLDCRKEIINFRNVLITTVTVSAMGLVAVLILVAMFSRLVFRPVEESFKKQKRFITDASHELKTPLTIIDANTEVMEMDTGETQWTKSTRKQVQRLTGMVQQLVTLTRLDEGRDADEKTEFSISEAVEEAAAPYEAPAQVNGKDLHIDIEENLHYVGNEGSIRQLVGILVDNAVKYTPQDGKIQVSLKKKGKKIYLEVINDAEEMPKGRLDMLFERFYRLDSSRNSKTGGSGIGLSIAEAIVHQHKGKITAESPDGHSLVICVIL